MNYDTEIEKLAINIQNSNYSNIPMCLFREVVVGLGENHIKATLKSKTDLSKEEIDMVCKKISEIAVTVLNYELVLVKSDVVEYVDKIHILPPLSKIYERGYGLTKEQIDKQIDEEREFIVSRIINSYKNGEISLRDALEHESRDLRQTPLENAIEERREVLERKLRMFYEMGK